MAGFRITKPYTMPKEAVREAAEELAQSLAQEHGLRSRWDGDRVKIKGAGVDGQLSFHDGLIDVSVKLGLLTSMFEGVIRDEVQSFLDQHVT